MGIKQTKKHLLLSTKRKKRRLPEQLRKYIENKKGKKRAREEDTPILKNYSEELEGLHHKKSSKKSLAVAERSAANPGGSLAAADPLDLATQSSTPHQASSHKERSAASCVGQSAGSRRSAKSGLQPVETLHLQMESSDAIAQDPLHEVEMTVVKNEIFTEEPVEGPSDINSIASDVLRRDDAHQVPIVKKERDYYDIFGELIAHKIRNLRNDTAKNTVEHLIGNILFEASLGKYDSPESAASTSFSSYPSSSSVL